MAGVVRTIADRVPKSFVDKESNDALYAMSVSGLNACKSGGGGDCADTSVYNDSKQYIAQNKMFDTSSMNYFFKTSR